MFKPLSLSLFAALLLLGLGCAEIPPVLNPVDGGGGSGAVADQKRQVLIEEFTGVRCVNCPAGSDAIQALLAAHGERLVAVSLHAGFFAVPFPESQQNFVTPAGTAVLSLVGESIGFPTAVVNRKRFAGEENRQVGQSTWAGYIADELVGEPEVKIDIQPTYNATTRQLDIATDLYIESSLPYSDVRLTVYITENNIVDSQLTPAGRRDDYVHKHVLRTAVTAFDGASLTESLTAGSVVARSFSLTLPDNWNADECHIVAFVHRGGEDITVLQAHEVAVTE